MADEKETFKYSNKSFPSFQFGEEVKFALVFFVFNSILKLSVNYQYQNNNKKKLV